MAVTYKVPQIKNGDKGIAVVLFQGIMKYRINGMSGKPFYEGEIDGDFGCREYKTSKRGGLSLSPSFFVCGINAESLIIAYYHSLHI